MTLREVCSVHRDLVNDVRDVRADVKALLQGQMRNRMLILFLTSTSAFGGSYVANKIFDAKNNEVRSDTFDVNIGGGSGTRDLDAGVDGGFEGRTDGP